MCTRSRPSLLARTSNRSDRRAGDGRGESWLPRAHALLQTTNALRELVGRLAYRVAGYM